MTTDIVSALPLPASKLAGRVREMPSGTRREAVRGRDLAHAARKAEATIDERGPKEPLRCREPAERHPDVAERGLESSRFERGVERRTEGWMRHDEGQHGGGGPEPADLHKVEVEDVAFAGKIRGREVRWVRLRCC